MVVTRIPPSPTGRLHIGTARTALFNYLFARHQGGAVIFRSEDTDRARSKKEFEDEILAGLTWLGLSWDSFSRQSERSARYNELLEKLVGEGKAYVSREPAKDDPSREVEVIRLKNPGTSITFTDLIRGDITFDTAELGDFVIARSLTDALYHFSVVVDDMDGGVTHVIRGEDHISNTPRQILIQEALGVSRPAYAHLPLILDERRAKLSKRSGTTVAMADYQAEGFLPEAMVNYLALLGWNPGTDEEYFSLNQLIKTFTLEGVQKGGASWDRTKLLSVNQHWMRKLSDEEYLTRGHLEASDAAMLRKVVPLLKERAQTFTQAHEMLTGELKCFFEEPILDKNLLMAKEPADRPGLTKTALESLIEPIKGLQRGVVAEEIKTVLMSLADVEEANGKGGRGGVLWPLRYALSGQERSPDPFTLVAFLGTDEAIKRIEKAIGILE
jgi:glutamyl-tRNA synthetase